MHYAAARLTLGAGGDNKFVASTYKVPVYDANGNMVKWKNQTEMFPHRGCEQSSTNYPKSKWTAAEQSRIFMILLAVESDLAVRLP